jgi:site-specific DNA-methyltransferase (adenine-specific)
MIDRITEQPFYQTRVMCRAVDNLELLLSQPDESVDLIYCDILYGTGRNFGDYQDLKPIRSEIEAHYLPRLKEMHRILKPTGSIYLQMDTKINHWVRCIMDDIFGYERMLNEIIWCYKSGGSSKKSFSKKHDIILCYTKTKEYTFNFQKEKSYGSGGGGQGGKVEYFKDKNGTYNFVGMKDWWEISMLSTTHPERVNYDTQKPKVLIERIIKASSNEGDTVADYYLGSGTTAVVCKELNRNFIGCDINPKAIEITKARLDAVS